MHVTPGPVAATACPDGTRGCTWLLDQGAPEWLATLVGALVAPSTQALAILLVTAIVAAVARRLVARIAARWRESATTRRLDGIARRRLDPRRQQRIDAVSQVVASIAVVAVWAIGVAMAVGAFGVSLGPLIASAGIIGVALGFGAQSLVKDFLSGMFMLAEDQFGVGDVINVGQTDGVIEGVVEEITLRTTSLRGVDGTLWFVPNGEIRRVGNMSQDWARALLDVSIAYTSDVDQAMEVIGRTAEAFAADPDHADLVLEDPEILGVQDLGADAVVIRMWMKTQPGEQWTLSRELRRRLKLALDDAGIDIPFPQRTVWLRREAGEAVDQQDVATAGD